MRRLLHDIWGATSIEYALIAVGIGVAIAVAVNAAGVDLFALLSGASKQLQSKTLG